MQPCFTEPVRLEKWRNKVLHGDLKVLRSGKPEMLKYLDESVDLKKGVALEIALIACAFSALTFAHFGLQFFHQTTWPVAQARIENVIVEDAPAAGESYTQHVKIFYTYSVQGKTYSTEEVAVPMVSGREVPKFLKQYAKGNAVEIHYNRSQPDVSQLASVSRNSILFLAIAALFALLVAAGLVVRKRIKKSAG